MRNELGSLSGKGELSGRLIPKSEDIADDVPSDAIKVIGRRVRVDRGQDIPYIAGYTRAIS